nr:phospholipase-like protein [Tanacetum cinerariifolium]
DLSKGRSGFYDRVFPEVARVKGIELNKLLHSQTDFNNLLDDDVIRVCLLLALDFMFLGFELRHVISKEVLNLVDDFSAWDNFPWGHYIWEEFHKMWFKEQNLIPRSVAWNDRTPFLKCDYDRLFSVRTRLSTLTPSSDEMNKPWWKSSLECFHNVSNASTSSHAPSNKTKSRFKHNVVSREVQIRTDVHHYVDEGLSVEDLTLVESDVDNQNVDNHFMDFDHDSKNMDNHSMDFDHDPKALEEPNVDQQFSAKKLDAQIEMKERFAVDTLCLMIDFDIPKEKMHNQLPIVPMIPKATVQGCNNFETAQLIITEYESQHAIHDHLETLSMKNVDSVQGSNDAKVDVNPTIVVNSLRVPLEQDHKVYLGSAKKGVVGCLIRTSTYRCYICGILDRQKLIGQLLDHFLTLLCFVTTCHVVMLYGVPWFAQSVEKVYFPINVEEVHRILAELHIRSGVVNLYDNLPLDDLTVEYQKWWLEMRACYATQILKLLLKTKVLDKKNIDPANYSITYRYAVNVPRQGDAYGDYGIWVM